MKLSKLAIAVSFFTVALTACGGGKSASPADFNITAIDGYIVNGNVTAHCGYSYQNSYTARTNKSGIAALFTEGAPITDCYVEISGDAQTYDTDAANEPWLYSMRSLPELAVINPYTDIAVTIQANNQSLTRKATLTKNELMLLVYDLLDPLNKLALSGQNLFADYGENSADNSGLDSVTRAKIAVLAQSTFDAVAAIKTKYAGATPANLQVLYYAVLPQVTTAVAAKMLEVGEDKLERLNFSAEVTLPDNITFNDEGELVTELTGLSVNVTVSDKPLITGAQTTNQG